LVDLNVATREVLAILQNQLRRNGVATRVELCKDLPPVAGDRVQLEQVILNLLLNAQEAMNDVDDRPKEILLRTERDQDDRVRLSVKDAGVGFGPQGPERLFEAFYTTKSSGMGVGLSVSRTIVESHHGKLWAAQNEGPGATFCFWLPCAQ
jgi:signal transduction histidine kinase